MSKVRAAWASLPVPVQKAIIDAIETGIAAALAVNYVMPTSVGEAKSTALVVFGAGAGAAVAALRRALLTYIASRNA